MHLYFYFSSVCSRLLSVHLPSIFITLVSKFLYCNWQSHQPRPQGAFPWLFPPHLQSQGKAPWERGWMLPDEKLYFVSAHSGRLYLKPKYRTQIIQNIIFSFIFNFHSLSFSSPWGRSARCWILLLFPPPRRTMHYCGNLCFPQMTIPHTIENWDWTWVSSGLNCLFISNQFLIFSFDLRGNLLSEINTPTVRIEPVFTWRQGGHIGVPKQSSGSRLLMRKISFVALILHRCWSREWQRSKL